MKSYFAKLAARATVANIPVAPSRFPGGPDPFEAVAPEFVRSPPTIPQPSGVRADAAQPNSRQPVLKTESPISGDVVTIDPRRSDDRETTFQPLRRVQQPTETPSATVQIPSAQETVSAPTENPSLRHEQQPTQLIPSENEITTPLSPKFSADLPESEATREPRSPGTDAQLEEIQREQSVLLRKADAFMSALLERRSKTTDSSIERQADFERPPSKAESPHPEIPARLQPPAPIVSARDDRSDQPSLVIGKLTVEVMPPPAPPVAPSRQVVIVREGRSVRGAARNSIKRFGLGQF